MLNVKYFIYWQLLAGQLQDQVNATDPSVRSSTQSSAWGTGSLLHNLGAFLLELGRTTMTLRLGQTPVGLSMFPVYGIFSIMRSHVLYVLLLPNVICSQKPWLMLDPQFSYHHLVLILSWFRQCSHLI